MASFTLTLDTGAGSLQRSTTFDSTQMARLQTWIDAELLERGVSSPSNNQRMDFLWGVIRADVIGMIRSRERAGAAAAISDFPL